MILLLFLALSPSQAEPNIAVTSVWCKSWRLILLLQSLHKMSKNQCKGLEKQQI
jgi:hypothetical protein